MKKKLTHNIQLNAMLCIYQTWYLINYISIQMYIKSSSSSSWSPLSLSSSSSSIIGITININICTNRDSIGNPLTIRHLWWWYQFVLKALCLAWELLWFWLNTHLYMEHKLQHHKMRCELIFSMIIIISTQQRKHESNRWGEENQHHTSPPACGAFRIY